jgi:hypothetical protein
MDKKISEKASTQRGEFVGLMKARRGISPGRGGEKTGRGKIFCCLEEVKLLYII